MNRNRAEMIAHAIVGRMAQGHTLAIVQHARRECRTALGPPAGTSTVYGPSSTIPGRHCDSGTLGGVVVLEQRSPRCVLAFGWVKWTKIEPSQGTA